MTQFYFFDHQHGLGYARIPLLESHCDKMLAGPVLMEKLEITRNDLTDQFSVVLVRGNDTIRCMVTVETGRAYSHKEKHRAALLKAKALAKALDEAIAET